MTGVRSGGSVRALALILTCGFLAGCARTPPADHELRIGVIAMLSGSASDKDNGRKMTSSAQLLADETNRAGGLSIRGRPLRVVLSLADDHNSPDGAVEAARRLINVDRVTAIVGPQFSRNAIAAARLAESERTVMVCPLSTNPLTTLGRRYVFRVPFLDGFQGSALAAFAFRDLNAAAAAMLYDVSNEYNRTLAGVFGETFTHLGGRIVASETYTSDTADEFRPQLRRIAAAAPDVLFLPNLSDDVLLQGTQARSLGIDATLLGGDGWDPEAFARRRSFDGSFSVAAWFPGIPGPAVQSFTTLYTRTYGESPGSVAATTWDAVGLVLAAVRKAGRTDSDSIRGALLSMEPYPGVTGTITYRASGDPKKSLVLVRIKGSAASIWKLIEPEGP